MPDLKLLSLAALVFSAPRAQDALPSSAFIVVGGDTIKGPAGIR